MTKVSLVAGRRFMPAIRRLALLLTCASALVLSPVSPALAALTCIAGNLILNYGSYDILAGAALDVAGTITVSCTKTGPTPSAASSSAAASAPGRRLETRPRIDMDEHGAKRLLAATP